ncbi:MAG TPA: TetR/AcrR family transcriptional regulator [Acidimicrobiales bacterium]|nr:TetR/AcrR family transcriptional regulator [Acidimicrobiales bacterium]
MRQSIPARPAKRDDRRPRRDQILEVAARLFVERGFRGTSIDDLGAAVGVSGPAIYRYFPSKEAVLAALLIGVSKDLVKGARSLLDRETPTDTLRGLVAFHVRFALEHPELITVQSRDLDCLADPQRAQVRSLQREYIDAWVEAVRRLSPGIDPLRVLAAVHATFGLINSTPHSARLDREEMNSMLQEMSIAALASLDAGETSVINAEDDRRYRDDKRASSD